MDNHLNNQKMDGSEPQNLPFLLLSSKAIIKSDVYDSTLNGSRTSPGYGQTGRMAGMGQGGRFSLSGRYSGAVQSICVQAKLEQEFCLVPILPEFVVRSGGYLAGTG